MGIGAEESIPPVYRFLVSTLLKSLTGKDAGDKRIEKYSPRVNNPKRGGIFSSYSDVMRNVSTPWR